MPLISPVMPDLEPMRRAGDRESDEAPFSSWKPTRYLICPSQAWTDDGGAQLATGGFADISRSGTHDGGAQLRGLAFSVADAMSAFALAARPHLEALKQAIAAMLPSADAVAELLVVARPYLEAAAAALVAAGVQTAERSRNLEVMTPPHVETIRWIKSATGFSQARIGRLAGVSRQTVYFWETGGAIKSSNRQRLFAVRDVLERAATRYQTPRRLAAWLDTPRGADARTPAELLEAAEIDRARLLAVTSPSPGLKPPPAWVRRPIPEAFRSGAEHPQEATPPELEDALLARLDALDDDDGGAEEVRG